MTRMEAVLSDFLARPHFSTKSQGCIVRAYTAICKYTLACRSMVRAGGGGRGTVGKTLPFSLRAGCVSGCKCAGRMGRSGLMCPAIFKHSIALIQISSGTSQGCTEGANRLVVRLGTS